MAPSLGVGDSAGQPAGFWDERRAYSDGRIVEQVRSTPYGLPFGIAPADVTFGATSGVRGYGVPGGTTNSDDHSYYLVLYAASSALSDLTTSATSGTTGYGVPNGTVNSDD